MLVKQEAAFRTHMELWVELHAHQERPNSYGWLQLISPDSIELGHDWEHWQAKASAGVVCDVGVWTIPDLWTNRLEV